MADEKASLPYGTFGPQLDSLYEAVRNKLRVQWPSRLNPEGAVFLLQGIVAVSHVTHRVIVHLCSDNPIAEGRKPEYALAATPLIRTLLDGVFTLVFLLDNLDERKEQFHKGGWREIREEHDRLQQAYGSEAEWEEWLAGFRDFVERGRVQFGITDDEVTGQAKLPYWPTPSQMRRDPSLDGDRRAYLEYLNDWWYRELSSDSHLSLPGLSRRAMPLLEGQSSWDDYRSNCVFAAATLSIALLSEIQLEIKWPDLTPRFEYIWTVLIEHWPDARELYVRRYKDKL